MRVSPAEYLSLPLRAHALLHDVPLYDVSIVELPGGGPGRTVSGSVAPGSIDMATPVDVEGTAFFKPAWQRLSACRECCSKSTKQRDLGEWLEQTVNRPAGEYAIPYSLLRVRGDEHDWNRLPGA